MVRLDMKITTLLIWGSGTTAPTTHIMTDGIM